MLRVICMFAVLYHGVSCYLYPKDPSIMWETVNITIDAVGDLCKETTSLLLLHDGSPSAIILVHSILTQHSTTKPRQVANIITWHSNTKAYYLNHNSEFGLTLLVIYNTSSLQHLHHLNSGWIYGPIILVALNPHQHFTEDLRSINSARYSMLLQPVALLKPGTYGLALTTLFPFNPPYHQFNKQILQAHVPLTQRQLLVNRFADFGGHTLELASWVDEFPVIYWSDLSNTTATGSGIKMMDELSCHLNFTYLVQPVTPDGQWADYINDSWTGLMGQLVRKEKDIIINNVAMMHDRLNVVDFSTPVRTDSFSIVLKLPPPPQRWRAAFYPFTTNTWSALAATLVLISIFFHILIWTNTSGIYYYKLDVISTLVWMIRVLLNQSVPRIPSCTGTQPFLVCWWLVSLVLAASFVSNIIAYITVPQGPNTIKTMQQLAHSKHPLYMGDYGTWVPEYLATSNDSVHRSLASKLHLIPIYDHLGYHISVNDGAFIESSGYMEFAIERFKLDEMYFLQEVLFPYTTGWTFQKGTPWVTVFNWYLRSMIESGLIDRWTSEEKDKYNKRQGHVTSKTASTENNIRPLSLQDLQSAFFILAIGILISTLIIAIEITINYIN